MLKYDFPLYSDQSRTLLELDGRDLIAEVERSATAHRAAAPGRIARGAMTEEEAERIGLVLDAIAADLEAYRAWKLWDPPLDQQIRRGAFSWEDKLHVLRREIHFRRSYDADRVARGRITAAAAREQLERLEAVHVLYWRDWLPGFPWPEGGAAPEWGNIRPSPGAQLTRQAMREHWAKISSSGALRCAPEAGQDQEQETMAL